MGLFSSKPSPARQEHKAARRDLEKVAGNAVKKYGKGNAPETDEYLRANQRVIDAEKNVPWYQR